MGEDAALTGDLTVTLRDVGSMIPGLGCIRAMDLL